MIQVTKIILLSPPKKVLKWMTFVCLLAGIHNNYWIAFVIIKTKYITLLKEEGSTVSDEFV